MVKILLTDRKGRQHVLSVPDGTQLMETLRDLPDGVAAICGGIMACGTCRVLIEDRWRALLDPQQSDELAVLDTISSAGANSRLSCQIKVIAKLEGMEVTL